MSEAIEHKPIIELLSVQQTSPKIFTGRVPIQYCFGKVAFGGWPIILATIATQRHLTAMNRPSHPFDLNITFLRPLAPGDAEIRIDPLKLGSKICVVAFSVLQGGKDAASGHISTTDLDREVGMTFDIGFELLPKPVTADVSKLANNSEPAWVRWTVNSRPKDNMQMWSNFHFFSPKQGSVHPSLVDMWITPALAEDSFTNESLLLAADMFVRPLENHRTGSWASGPGVVATANAAAEAGFVAKEIPTTPFPWMIPTHSIKLEVKRRLPPKGIKWLFLRAQITALLNGRFDVNVIILNEQGEVLVTSSQVSWVIDASANSPSKL